MAAYAAKINAMELFPYPAARKAVLRRAKEEDALACGYCDRELGEGKITTDHIVPVAMGGEDAAHNLTCACFKCNHSKGAMSLAEWRKVIAQKAEYANDPIKGSPGARLYFNTILANLDTKWKDAMEMIPLETTAPARLLRYEVPNILQRGFSQLYGGC